MAMLMGWRTDQYEPAEDDLDASSEMDTSSDNPAASSQQDELDDASPPDFVAHQEVIEAVTGQSAEEVHTWSTFTVVQEWFEFDDVGRLTSIWNNNSKNLKISVRDEPLTLGSRMEVSIVSWHSNDA